MKDDFMSRVLPDLFTWRRRLHQQPELGFMEYKTTFLIGKELEKLGYELHIGKDALKSESRLGLPTKEELEEQEQKALRWGVDEESLEKMSGGNTGLAAILDTGRPGDHVAFRFDIDALPINESEDSSHLPFQKGFRSREPDVMHACGHDGHTTIGIGVARYIAEKKDTLRGKFTLLFQPAEEGGRGAKAMTDKGWLQGVHRFYTGHIGIEPMPVGTIAATTEGFLASSKMNIRYKGIAAHAGMKPEDGKNALLAGATAATQLYSIPRHSGGATRINVGRLEAGSGRNIISDTAYLEVETRGETKDINNYVWNQAKRMLHASASMHDVELDIAFVGETEEINCDAGMIDRITHFCETSDYVQRVLPVAPVSGSEDASFMVNAVQKQGGEATYMLFGTQLPYGHHHPAFDFDEAVLPVALDTYIHILKGGSSYA